MSAPICDFLLGGREGGSGGKKKKQHLKLPETQEELSGCLEALSSETRTLALELYM